ncbi:MAG TPA: type II secretion system protein [bacterium]|nr:type II secretion system protein [bacterium]HOL48000.1 type II secretion system protein [bacterium]HPQ18598.1 type II secretion system protein [bacterium]
MKKFISSRFSSIFKTNSAFTLSELIIVIFIIALLSSILFISFDLIKEKLSYINEESEKIKKIDSFLNFINLSLKYLYINKETGKFFLYTKNIDSLNNRKDILNFYSTYPAGLLKNFEIKFEDENMVIFNKTDNDTYLNINEIEQFEINFFYNDKNLLLNNINEENQIFDFNTIKIKIILKKEEYNIKIKPFILN